MADNPLLTPSAPAVPVAPPVSPASATPPSPAPSGAPSAIPPVGGDPAPSAGPGAVAPPTPAEIQRFKLKIDGREAEVDLEELKRGYIGGATWTQRSQQLAEERRRLQQEAEAFQARQNGMRGELEKLQNLMTDPNALERYLSLLRASNGGQSTGQPDLDAPVTKAEFQVMIQRQVEGLKNQFQTTLSEMQNRMQQMQRHREVSTHSLAFDKFLDGFITEHSGLTELYDRNELMQSIKAEAAQRVQFAAETNQEVRDWQEFSLAELKSAAERKLARVQPYLQNRAKLDAITAPAQPGGMVPPVPGAPAPMPQPKAPLKLGSKDMLSEVTKFIEAGGAA